jgi:hypothetical protein
MSISSLDFKEDLTPRQRESIKRMNFNMKKKKGVYTIDKPKYWCPIKKDYYTATPQHIHCKLCFEQYKGEDRHEIIEYKMEEL